MDVKEVFEVTAKAGLFVAGFRSPGAGNRIALTAEQAAYALASGELVRPGQAAKRTAAARTPKSDADKDPAQGTDEAGK